jgi:Family of unknown function (DUF5330)
MGLLRNFAVLGAIAFAMPNPPAAEQSDGIVPPTVSSLAYVSAAAQTFADLKGFCERQVNVCDTAGRIAVTMEAKAKYSAKLIYEWANEAGNPQASRSPLPKNVVDADPISTGSLSMAAKHKVSQSTLLLDDLLPAWQEPRIKG